MEEFMFVGYKYYEMKNNDGTINKGYTLYMLEPLKKENGNYGYAPVRVYNQYQNVMKFPTVTADFFVEHNIAIVKASEPVLVTISRNKITDFKLKTN